MKLTYAYKELFYDVKNTYEVKKAIKFFIERYGPLDRAKLRCNDKEIWQEDWVDEDYNPKEELSKIIDENVFLSFKSDSMSCKLDIYFHKEEKK